ncbi:RING-H2 finger protein ATL1-like [Curcuma longa]|uniref:RING-H2 finger protein ATL1-like n=1 Tax=Curcuma longa TaxID=136217 RepID=UPI003D9E08FE
MAASPLMAAAKPPPSAPRSSSSSPPPILAVAILGILTTAILLLSYYLFVTKCRTGRRLRSPLTKPARGLHPSLIRSIPVVNFTAASNDIEQRSQCAVCLNEFQNMERLKLLPGCSHTFHIDCIETWLQFNQNCPLCRSDVTASTAAMPAQFILVFEQSRSAGPTDASAEITGQTSTTLTRKF